MSPLPALYDNCVLPVQTPLEPQSRVGLHGRSLSLHVSPAEPPHTIQQAQSGLARSSEPSLHSVDVAFLAQQSHAVATEHAAANASIINHPRRIVPLLPTNTDKSHCHWRQLISHPVTTSPHHQRRCSAVRRLRRIRHNGNGETATAEQPATVSSRRGREMADTASRFVP